jgi:hypothetical protein
MFASTLPWTMVWLTATTCKDKQGIRHIRSGQGQVQEGQSFRQGYSEGKTREAQSARGRNLDRVAPSLQPREDAGTTQGDARRMRGACEEDEGRMQGG